MTTKIGTININWFYDLIEILTRAFKVKILSKNFTLKELSYFMISRFKDFKVTFTINHMVF